MNRPDNPPLTLEALQNAIAGVTPDVTAEQIQALAEVLGEGPQVKERPESGSERRRARRTAEREAARQNQRAIQTGTFKRVEQDYLQRIVGNAPSVKAVKRVGDPDWINPRGGLFA